jgi:UDP-N-acetylmuramoyl-tripeptide--D-alanyl-D-alanine ligase
LKLKDAIEYMRAEAPSPDPALPESEVVSFAIDSREVKAGDVFFALSQPDYSNNGFNGDFEDATKYAAQALKAGAAACVLRPDRFEEHKAELEPYKDRLIFADDVIKALQRLAHGVYLDWNKTVVAVTGSAGKTTAKELTAHVLEAGGRRVLKNIKNYNNGLGHPLTVLNLAADPGYDAAVLEMGMSTPMREIARLCEITPPDIAIVLNVLPVHLEHLGSIEGVARAKAEIVEGMKPGGTAVLNGDDPRVAAMAELSRGVVTFGIENPADVMASDIASAGFGKTEFTLATPTGEARVRFPLNGRHNILNALAAAGAGHALGMTAEAIAERLSSAAAPTQRGEVLEFAAGFTVINDSYNSNPDALMSMVQTLVEGAGDRRKIVVAGEMLELGPESDEIHRRTGAKIAASGADMLIGVRGVAREMVTGAIAAGLDAEFAEDSAAAGERLAAVIKEGDVVLVKGSRGVRTERVVEEIQKRFEAAAGSTVAGMAEG